MHLTRDRAEQLARPFRERLRGDVDGITAAGWLRGDPRAVAMSGAWLGGATILTSHPLSAAGPSDDPFAALDRMPVKLEASHTSPAVVVGGGWFGWFGFRLASHVEPVPPPPPRAISLPKFDLAFHDHVVLRDAEGCWWFEALWTQERSELLAERLACWRERVAAGPPPASRFSATSLRPVAPGLTGHRHVVREGVQRIAAGDLSQANLCLRLEADFDGDPLELWRTAVVAGRPPQAAYVSPGSAGQAVASLSPELFLRRAGRQVLTRPIKGTAPASSDPELLSASEKDRAENVMIVDLMRNDLGRVCRYGSIEVEELCAARPAPGVWQLESSVRGELRPGVSDSELLRATFPPGSVTGAPKVQALRTIHDLEATARECYCGAIGLCSPIAGLELSVAIRTLEVARGRLWLGAGGGIVADSDPAAEVDEALIKARGVASAAGLALDTTAYADTDTDTDTSGPTPPRFSRQQRPDPAGGVIETILVSRGRALHLNEHLARLSSSCAELELALPDQLETEIAAVAMQNPDAALRVTVDRTGTSLATRPLPPPGVTDLAPLTVPGGLGAHKWADRGLIGAHSAPGVTPLICDSDVSVLEAGYAAIMLVSDHQIIAPPLDGRLLPSLSRKRLLDGAQRHGWEISLRPISLAEVDRADAIVLTSSLRGPHEARLAGRALAPQAGEVIEALRRAAAPVQEIAASSGRSEPAAMDSARSRRASGDRAAHQSQHTWPES